MSLSLQHGANIIVVDRHGGQTKVNNKHSDVTICVYHDGTKQSLKSFLHRARRVSPLFGIAPFPQFDPLLITCLDSTRRVVFCTRYHHLVVSLGKPRRTTNHLTTFPCFRGNTTVGRSSEKALSTALFSAPFLLLMLDYTQSSRAYRSTRNIHLLFSPRLCEINALRALRKGPLLLLRNPAPCGAVGHPVGAQQAHGEIVGRS